MQIFFKDPQAKLDYRVDWSAWLNGDSISASTWTIPAGLTKVSDTKTATTTTIWLADGVAGESYIITNHIVTVGGREDDVLDNHSDS